MHPRPPWVKAYSRDPPDDKLHVADVLSISGGLADVWLEPERQPETTRSPRKRVYATLIGVSAGLGAALGVILTALLMR